MSEIVFFSNSVHCFVTKGALVTETYSDSNTNTDTSLS